MMSSSQVQPFYLRNQISEFHLHRCKSGFQIRGILLAKGVKVNTIQ